MNFEALNLHQDILKGVKEAGFEHCTPIQEQSLPECVAGKDVIAQSQTGTGKTAVFLLTIFSRLMESGQAGSKRPRALVMVPTRELASQVIDDAAKLGKFLPLNHVAIYGGVEYNAQVNSLKEGVDIVVATPGRMIDLHKSRTLSLDEIEIFVIDEADRMFDMGFAPDIIYIAGRLPKKKPRQTMLFSATIDDNVRRLASRYMKPDPVIIEIEPEQVTVDAIDQKVIYVSNEEKLSFLLTLLKRPEVERCIIFTNMKITAERVGWKLAANGLPAKVLTGDVNQARREKIIDGMKSGTLKILVATDVAARGLHIEDVTHVVNYDLPDDAANYVHRIGRTARAGKSGKAYSLVCEDHALNLPEIEKYIERKIDPEWIEESEIIKDTAPAYQEKRRSDGFKKGGSRPGSHGSQGGGHDKGGRRNPRDRKPRPEQAKRAEPIQEQAQKEAAVNQPKNASAQQEKRPGQQDKRPQLVPRPPRREHQDGNRKGPGSRPPRHGRSFVDKKRDRTEAPKPAPAHEAKPAHVPHAPAVKHEPVKEQAQTNAKPGLLKRFLKFLKKD